MVLDVSVLSYYFIQTSNNDLIEDTTDMSASYIGLHLEIDREPLLRMKRYNKTFNFHICELSIYPVYVSVDMVFQSLRIILVFLW